MNRNKLRSILQQALDEDIGMGDITSSIFPDDHVSSGTFTAKATGVLAGLSVIRETYHLLDKSIEINLLKKDGDAVVRGAELAEVQGPTACLLTGERVILNMLQHLSGIATSTRKAVDALNDVSVRICDTRKTLPGLRMLQKYAVRCGGGYNHRYRLDDGVIIKDNHIVAAGSITEAVGIIRSSIGHMVRVEVETETRKQVLEAVEAGADVILLDNRSPNEVRELADLVPDSVITEISGGITLENIANYQNTGVDYISLGFLTHSVTALDISFNL